MLGVLGPENQGRLGRRTLLPARARLAMCAALCAWSAGLPCASAAVDLVLLPDPATVAVGETVDVGLYAVSDDGSDQEISGLSVVMTWNANDLELEGDLHNGPYAWSFSGFLPDPQADGLNDSFLDGNAFYQAVVNFTVPAVATAEGLLVTTFRFKARAKTAAATIVIEPELGIYSKTQVLQFDVINRDIKGALGTADITIIGAAGLAASDVWVPAGRKTQIVVSGDLDDRNTFGVTILLELAPLEGAVGTVIFTPPPPVDIVQAGDPWPGVGVFIRLEADEDMAVSATQNGSSDDNGTYIAAPLTFRGALSAFPVVADEGASGAWNIRLVANGRESSWEGLPTTLTEATLWIVDPADGDGNGTIDLFDLSEFMTCFTGPGGSFEDPIYSLSPRDRCVVYDLNADGAIDQDDYGQFPQLMNGPDQ